MAWGFGTVRWKCLRLKEHVRTGTEVADGLRGLAIAMVVAFHLWSFSWYTPPGALGAFARTGYLGVELFFVLSGFCLFFPYARHAIAGAPKETFGTFAYRRFLKIVPSYWIALLGTCIIAFPYLGNKAHILGPLGLHLAFLNNFHNDILGWIDGAFWSLAVEMQFYLLFPLLAIAFMRLPLVSLGGCLLLAFGYRYLTASPHLLAEPIVRQVPAYIDVFGVGMFAAYAVVYARTKFTGIEHMRTRFTLLALGALAASLFVFRSVDAIAYDPVGQQHWNLFGRTLLAATLGTVLCASCLSAAWWRGLLANRALVFLSIVSYNVYLWHAVIMVWLALRGMRPATYGMPGADGSWKLAFIATSVGVTLALATAVTYFIERPLLALARPQTFAFRWPRLGLRPALQAEPQIVQGTAPIRDEFGRE
jgi:peptidoglycan/LPS O-acetylase OafA/YrhL